MSQDLHVYAHRVGYIITPYTAMDEEKTKDMSVEKRIELAQQLEEINQARYKTYGLLLLHLSTTPIRNLRDEIPYTEEPKKMTGEMIDKVLSYYENDIKFYKDNNLELEKKNVELEKKMLKAKTEAACKVFKYDIEDNNQFILDNNESIEDAEFYKERFEMLKEIYQHMDKEQYELIYTNC